MEPLMQIISKPDLPKTAGVFGLAHPDEPTQIRYIAGASNQRHRYYFILSTAWYGHNLNIVLEAWLREILNSGREPVFILIEDLSNHEGKLYNRERSFFWIKHFVKTYDLLNGPRVETTDDHISRYQHRRKKLHKVTRISTSVRKGKGESDGQYLERKKHWEQTGNIPKTTLAQLPLIKMKQSKKARHDRHLFRLAFLKASVLWHKVIRSEHDLKCRELQLEFTRKRAELMQQVKHLKEEYRRHKKTDESKRYLDEQLTSIQEQLHELLAERQLRDHDLWKQKKAALMSPMTLDR